MSSWLGGLLLQVGEWIIRKLPLVKHIYSAAKQARARHTLPSARGAASEVQTVCCGMRVSVSHSVAWQGHRALDALSCTLCPSATTALCGWWRVSLQQHSIAHSLGTAQWHCTIRDVGILGSLTRVQGKSRRLSRALCRAGERGGEPGERGVAVVPGVRAHPPPPARRVCVRLHHRLHPPAGPPLPCLPARPSARARVLCALPGYGQTASGSSGCALTGCGPIFDMSCAGIISSYHVRDLSAGDVAVQATPYLCIYIYFQGLLVQRHATQRILFAHTVPRTNSAVCLQEEAGDIELLSVYVPTNHIYIGDIFLLQRADVIRTSLSVREGLGKASLCMFGMSIPRLSSMRLRL